MSSVLEDYAQFRSQLEGELSKVERLIADIENQYIASEQSQTGSVFKGYEGFLSSKEASRKRARSSKPDERLFSLSSKSSPVTREQDQAAMELGDAMVPAGFGKKGYAQKGYAQKGKR